MQIKIKRISIQNFKPFQNFERSFPDDNLVVFDGPNGFGKTSFYDAIEIIFTGTLRRYAELVDTAVDRRNSVDGSPLLNTRSKEGDLIIKAELEVNGEPFFIMRKAIREELEKETRLNSFHVPLYELTSFKDINPKRVEQDKEKDILSSKFGTDYIRNFEHLNYIEQQENIYLLKGTDTNRAKAIDHLFNTTDFQAKISKIEEALKRIRKLCNKEIKDKRDKMSDELTILKEKLIHYESPISFSKIITWKEINWDKENIKFTDEQYSKWLKKDGELEKVSLFVKNYESFKADRNNKEIDSLLKNKKIIVQYLKYWNFLEQEPQYSVDFKLDKSIKKFVKAFEKSILDNIDNGENLLTSEIEEHLNNNQFDLTKYKQSLIDIKNKKNTVNYLSKILVGIKETRQEFINKFKKYGELENLDGNCPLCGYTWNDVEELERQFNLQADQLEKIINETGTDLNDIISNFNIDIIQPIINHLKEYIVKKPVDIEAIEGLQEAIKKRTDLTDLNKRLTALKIDTNLFLVNELSSDIKPSMDVFQSILNEMKTIVGANDLELYFEDIFLNIFEEKQEYVLQATFGGLEAKRTYIEWQYSLYQSDVIKSSQKEYDYQCERIKLAESQKKKLKKLQDVYKNSLKQYQKSFISKIEILFHIYSGRIAQDSKNSLGLFIDAEKGIRFLESHDKTHDAVFTMSSGQLATLVIAFTLALNQRFSKNKLLFIDDPVQTLDELNVAGFIELLRNDFSDHQIFISTHEDVMSAYMRYKFEKYNLGATRLDFKESQLSEVEAV